MTLETRFTIEELAYLKGLSTRLLPKSLSMPEQMALSDEGWTRNEIIADVWGCIPSCDMWGHRTADYYYYRHGESLVKFPRRSNTLMARYELKLWLDDCHGHDREDALIKEAL